MIKQIAAITAAAVCAALIVGVAPEIAVGSSQTIGAPVGDIGSVNRVADGGALARIEGGTQHKTACAQGWPYYEKVCMHNGRQSDGKLQVVRMIAIDRVTNSGKLQARD